MGQRRHRHATVRHDGRHRSEARVEHTRSEQRYSDPVADRRLRRASSQGDGFGQRVERDVRK